MAGVRIGEYAVQAVVELERPFVHAQAFYPDLTDEMLATCRRELPAGRLAANDFINMSFNCFVVQSARHTILVDTCCGNDKERPTRPEYGGLNTDFLGALARAGVRPEAVDYVMCTHLHWDHVGWNTRLVDGRWVPTFPNAKYVVSRTEYAYWDAAYRSGMPGIHVAGFADSVLPVKQAEQVMIVGEDHQLEDGVVLEPCFGHSPGHVVINLASQGARAALTGDVIHHQIQLRYPTLSTMADFDRDMARTTRMALLERLAGDGSLLLPAHFPSPTIGRLGQAAEGFRFDPA